MSKEQSLLGDIVRVSMDTLIPHPRNPRRGDIDAVAESLQVNKQYRPLVVQQSTNYIIAGNHTFLAAKKIGWREIDVTMIDVDEQHAFRIMLADNKTADRGTYDIAALADILAELPDANVGTGYDESEIDRILTGIEIAAAETVAEVQEQEQSERTREYEQRKSKTFMGSAFGEEEDQAPVDSGEFDLDEDASEAQGIRKLDDDVTFDGVGPWDIPRLRTDQIMTWDEIPTNFLTWAGSATKNWPDPDVWWLYNWGIDSTSGMRDVSKVVLSFYAWDTYFDSWWETPARYVTKVLNSKIKYAITPNFTQETHEPRVLSLNQLYKARWLGRFFQEAGLRIIPDVTWRDGDMDWLENVVLATLPKNLPLISMTLQNIDPKEVVGGIDHFKAQVRKVFEVLQPQAALIYMGKQAEALLDEVVPADLPVCAMPSRLYALGEQAKRRGKKTTI